MPWLYPEEGDSTLPVEAEGRCLLEQCAIYYNMAKYLGIPHLTVFGEKTGTVDRTLQEDRKRGLDIRRRSVVLDAMQLAHVLEKLKVRLWEY